ncbi:hypothetical protein QYF36_021053 [Acer negundo]|nr:hypothetical protein QYF36_021053 [Acer negundo]
MPLNSHASTTPSNQPIKVTLVIFSQGSFNVQNVGSLEEKVVALDVDEGLKLLKASLECKNVLSTVFLGDSVMRKGNCGSAIQSTGKVIGPKSRTKSGGMGLDTNMSPKRLSKVITQTTLFLLSLATVAFFRRPSQFFLHLCSSSIRETSKTDMEASQVNLKLLIDTKNVGSLKEKIVVLGVDEGLELLKASLEC